MSIYRKCGGLRYTTFIKAKYGIICQLSDGLIFIINRKPSKVTDFLCAFAFHLVAFRGIQVEIEGE